MEYSYLNGNTDEEYYREGIYVGYRYFDSYDAEPRYPFGYGLSYTTTFSLEKGGIQANGPKITIDVKVKNTGSVHPGKEVVQLYVSCPRTKTAKEYQQLAAFVKTRELKPGESETVSLVFDLKDLASYREEDGGLCIRKRRLYLAARRLKQGYDSCRGARAG